jgi:hypothetical protein
VRSSRAPATPTTLCVIGKVASRTIESGERKSRSCVSAIGPISELSIGSTPSETSVEAAASITAAKLGSPTGTAPGTSTVAAAFEWLPSGPG